MRTGTLFENHIIICKKIKHFLKKHSEQFLKNETMIYFLEMHFYFQFRNNFGKTFLKIERFSKTQIFLKKLSKQFSKNENIFISPNNFLLMHFCRIYEQDLKTQTFLKIECF